MRLKTILAWIIPSVIILGIAGCGKKNNDIVYQKKYLDEIKEAREKAIFFMASNYIPGAAFAISVDGKLVYSEGMGLSSKDLEVPATRKTKFRIGQVSELFTSLIYQLMVENGTLNPDSTVQYYLPDYPQKKYKITLKQLVNQTSGIREPKTDEKNWRGLNISLQQGLNNFKNDSLAFPPDKYQMLSLYNYNLLGAIMEKASGKHYHELLKDYITDTLHLENTVVDHPFITIKNRTDFFDYNYIMQVVNATFRDMRYRAPSEGLLSTAEDLVKFGNAILFSEYIPENIKKRLFEPVELADKIQSKMANGWMLLKTSDEIPVYGRGGSVTGGSGVMLVYPEQKIVVACASNLNVGPENIPVFDMAKPFLPGNESEKKSEK